MGSEERMRALLDDAGFKRPAGSTSSRAIGVCGNPLDADG
jgi:hypothetical protein